MASSQKQANGSYDSDGVFHETSKNQSTKSKKHDRSLLMGRAGQSMVLIDEDPADADEIAKLKENHEDEIAKYKEQVDELKQQINDAKTDAKEAKAAAVKAVEQTKSDAATEVLASQEKASDAKQDALKTQANAAIVVNDAKKQVATSLLLPLTH